MAELTPDERDGETLPTTTGARGIPVFLFVHGWACDRQCWAAQLNEFSRDHRCVAVDLRGRGGSPATPPFGVGRALEDLAALIRELGAGPVVVVGHSLGGIIALALNGRYRSWCWALSRLIRRLRAKLAPVLPLAWRRSARPGR